MASTETIINEILIRAKAEGFRTVAEDLARGMAAASGYTGEMFRIVDVEEKKDAALRRSERTMDTLSKRYVEGYRGARELEKITKDLATAIDKKASTTEQAAQILSGWAQKNIVATSSAEKLRNEALSAAVAIERLNDAITQNTGAGRTPATAEGATIVRLKELAEQMEMIDRARAEQAANSSQYAINQIIGIERVTKSARESAGAFMEMFAAEDEATRQTKELQAAAAALRAQVDPLGAATERAAQEQRLYNDMLARGLITEREYNQAIALSQQNFARRTQATVAVTGSMRNEFQRTSQQVLQLSYQLNDMLTMASVGASPGQIIGSQLGQIVQVFQNGEGSFGEQIRGIGRQIGGLLTPLRLATGGAAALGVAGVMAANDWRNSLDALSASMDGLGRRSAATLDVLVRIAQAEAAASRISTSTAMASLGAFTGAGISPDISTDLLGVVRPAARVLGTDATEAAKKLAEAFADPVKGADALNERLGFLNATTRNYIQSLVDQNDLHGAQRALLQALQKDLTDVTERTNALGNAWSWLTRKGSDMWTGFGAGVDRLVYGPDLTAQLDAARAARDEIANYLKSGEAGALGSGAEANWRAELAKRQAEVDRLQRELDAANRKAADDAAASLANSRSLAAETAFRVAQPQHDELRQLVARRNDIRDALGDPRVVDSMDPVQVDRYRVAMDALNQAIQTFAPASVRAAEADRLAIEAIRARTVAEEVAVAVAQKRLELAGKMVTAAEAERQIEAARAEVLARSSRDAADRLETSARNAALAGLTGYQRAMASLNAEFDRQIRLNGANADAVRDLTAARALDVEALRREATLAPLLGAANSLNSQIALMRVRRDTFGQSTEEVTKALEAQKLLNGYMEQGIPITASMTAAIDAFATKAGQAAAANEELATRQKEVIDLLDASRQFSRDSLGGLLKDLSKGKNPLESLINAGQRFADNLIDQGVSSFVEQTLGKDGTAQGPLGSFLADLFGAKDVGIPSALGSGVFTIGAANIQAGSLIISGT